MTLVLGRRIEGVLVFAGLGAALLTFGRHGLAPVLVAASVAAAFGLARDLPLSLAAACAAGAALIHFAVAPEHFGEWWGFGTFFVLCGEAQLGWAVLLRRRASGLVLSAGVAGSVSLVALWLLSRTAGLPLGPEPGVPEPAGTADLLAVSLELATAVGCAWTLVRSRRGGGSCGLRARAGLVAVVAGATAWALLVVSSG